jgi:hypothetical protein
MTLKATMTRFDENLSNVILDKPNTIEKWLIATEDITKVKKFISQEIKLALEEITPKETRIMKNSNPERRCGFIACLDKIEELKNNYLK